MIHNFFLFSASLFLCFPALTTTVFQDISSSSVSSVAESTNSVSTYDHVDMTKKRVWIDLQSTYWINETEISGRMGMAQIENSSGASSLIPSSGKIGHLYFFDIPFDTSSYRFASVAQNGMVVSVRTRATRCYETDNAYFHVVDGSNALDSLLYPQQFPSKVLTPDCLNSILEGYFPYRTNNTNGCGAFALLKSNVISQYIGGRDSLYSVSHWTVDTSGKEVYVSAEEKIEMLSKAYDSLKNDSSLDLFGGSKGLLLGSFLSACLMILFSWSLLSAKKEKKHR
jgi:hypothetical protein